MVANRLPLFVDARPRTRGDCIDGPRPCPWTACRHHNLLDVGVGGTLLLPPGVTAGPRGTAGSRIRSLAHLELRESPEELDERILAHLESMESSCSLDVADEGKATLEDIGRALGVTKERIRQLETRALAKLRARVPRLQG